MPVPLPFRSFAVHGSAVVIFGCSVKITLENSVPLLLEKN